MAEVLSRMDSSLATGLKRIPDLLRQNWLKSIGIAFVSMASVEYFAHHLFGCSLAAGLLLAYGSFRAYRRCEKIERAPLLAGTNDDFDATFGLVAATLFACLFACLAIISAPQEIKAFFHLP